MIDNALPPKFMKYHVKTTLNNINGVDKNDNN